MNQAKITEMMQKMSGFSMPTVDMNAFVSAGRRNMEAFTAATQMITESTQAIARRQMETARTSMEQAMSATRAMFDGKSPEMNMARQTEFAKSTMETAMQNLREMSDMATKSSFEAAQMLQERLSASMQEVQQAAAKK